MKNFILDSKNRLSEMQASLGALFPLVQEVPTYELVAQAIQITDAHYRELLLARSSLVEQGKDPFVNKGEE